MSCTGCSYKGLSTAIENNYVGVRFDEETNLTLSAAGDSIYAKGTRVVVESDSGPIFGQVEMSPMPVFKPCQKASAKRILRLATDEDAAAQERKLDREDAARRFTQERARRLGLEMKVAKVRFTLDCKRATVFFTADGRVDFRRLVREVSRRFSAKVRMTQVGARDEAALLGGVGICGRTLCCSTWLREFRPISIQMAKRQNLSLNPSKISGQCGRLLCCLAFEDDRYQKKPAKRRKPPAPASG